MNEPKTAEERVLILGKGPYLVAVDGREVERCILHNTATVIADDWRRAINTTVEMCCAAVPNLDCQPPAGLREEVVDTIREKMGVKT